MNAPLVLPPLDLRRRRARAATIFAVEFLTSLGTNLLMVGIFFYTSHRFGWNLRQNFMLAAGEGATYAVMALLAGPISARFGRRKSLVVILLGMAALAAATLAVESPVVVAALLLAYSGASALNWPMLESLTAAGLDARTLSRRMGTYNLVWSGAGAIIMAVNGALIEKFPAGVFLLPLIFHVIGAVVIGLRGDLESPGAMAPLQPQAHAAPEPALQRQRTLALWLSRIALPATFVITFGLMAMMPSLPVIQRLEPMVQTLLCSVWLGARWLAFLLLGSSAWWHARPRVLLLAAGAMLIAFLGTTVPPSALLGAATPAVDVASMVGWQIALGLSLGMIYTASLYFGMVLSAGSTEHGGYHEALIGLGSVLGPGAGVVAQIMYPGSVAAGVTAVAALVTLSVAAAAMASVRAESRKI